MKIFFATDIHGSEVCWRKFLNSAAFYKADLVVLGGDVTGKAMVPITAHNGYWQVTVRGQTYRLETREELEAMLTRIRNSGFYPAMVTPDELQHLSEEEGAVDRAVHHRDDQLPGPLAGHGRRQAQGRPDPVHPQRRQRRHLGDRRHHRAVAVRELRRGQGARPGRLPPDLHGLDQPDAVGHLPRGARARARGQDRGRRGPGPGHEADDLQLPRPALRHRAWTRRRRWTRPCARRTAAP